jgi:hypothetical protein
MHNSFTEVVKNYTASTICISILVAGVYSPTFFIPAGLLSTGLSYWLNRRVRGLPLRSELVAADYRKSWRESVFGELKKSTIAINEQLAEKGDLIVQAEAALKEKALIYQNWEESLIEAEKKLNEVVENNESYFMGLLEHQKQEYLAEIQMRENTISALQNKIMRIANRPDPKQGFAAWVAALLLQSLEQHEIYCRLISYQKIPGTREVSVWVELESGQVAKKLEAIAKEVGSWVKLGEPSITWDGDECIYEFHFSPAVFYEHDLIDEIDDAAGIYVEDVPSTFLEDFIKNTDRLSAFINGDSGSGKSTFVNNYISLIRKVLREGDEEVEVIIIDGKDPDSPWTIDGVQVVPQYGGINEDDAQEEDWIENDCLAGIEFMKQDVYSRLRAKRRARDEGRPAPIFSKRIYVIDEFEEIFSAYGKDASKPVLSAARLGRSGGVAVIPVGQSSNCSAYGFQIPNLNNFVRVYLRENAKKGIMDAVSVGSDRKPLLSQVSAREKISRGLSRSDPRKYWGFVKISGEPGVVMQMPAPNAYFGVPDESFVTLEAPKIFKPTPARTIIEAVEDAKKVQAIESLIKGGETRITEIICQVWGVKTSTRAYREAREEYRRIIGK